MKLVSIVIPVFNEEKNIPLVAGEIVKVFEEIDYEFELIFVNDGSRDGSILAIKQAAKKDQRMKGIDFSRNFGKEVATSAGCHFAQGEAVITMDADLQHPPELIRELIKKWEEGYEVVYTVRQENQGASWLKKLTSACYWWLLGKISSVQSEPHSTDFRLLDKKVLAEFKQFSERGRIFRGIIDWMGFKRTRVKFVAPERANGKASYRYSKLIALAVNSLTAFSLLPLKLAGYLGMLIILISGVTLLVMFGVRWFVNPSMFSPIAILAVGNTFLIGIVLICLGLIALYIARIHDEVVNRPLYIVRKKINIK